MWLKILDLIKKYKERMLEGEWHDIYTNQYEQLGLQAAVYRL